MTEANPCPACEQPLASLPPESDQGLVCSHCGAVLAQDEASGALRLAGEAALTGTRDCPACGARTPARESFCSSCGAATRPIATAAAFAQPATSRRGEHPKLRSARHWLWTLCAMFFVMGAVSWYYGSKTADELRLGMRGLAADHVVTRKNGEKATVTEILSAAEAHYVRHSLSYLALALAVLVLCFQVRRRPLFALHLTLLLFIALHGYRYAQDPDTLHRGWIAKGLVLYVLGTSIGGVWKAKGDQERWRAMGADA